MSFSKIYIEITNICNLNCRFCKGTARSPSFITPERFELYAKKAAPHTKHVYLHVMGEPLLHPQLDELIDIAAANGLLSSITTNGTLIKERLPMLVKKAEKLYKISISLHSSFSNEKSPQKDYLENCISSARALGERGVIAVLRLWCGKDNPENEAILKLLRKEFPEEWSDNRSGKKLGRSVYLEYGEEFRWPALDGSAPDYGGHGFCYAMKDHVAVLCDGRVVPCCLDADGAAALGDLNRSSLDEILNAPLAKEISEGIKNHSLTHPLCRHCGFAIR